MQYPQYENSGQNTLLIIACSPDVTILNESVNPVIQVVITPSTGQQIVNTNIEYASNARKAGTTYSFIPFTNASKASFSLTL